MFFSNSCAAQIYTQKLFNDSGIFFRKVFLTSHTAKIIFKLYRILRTHPHHCSMVLEYSCFLMTRKAKSVNKWGRVGMALPLLYFYCNLICELLHVLIINPNYTRTYHNIYVVRVFIYPKSFVCVFVCLFIPSFFLVILSV